VPRIDRERPVELGKRAVRIVPVVIRDAAISAPARTTPTLRRSVPRRSTCCRAECAYRRRLDSARRSSSSMTPSTHRAAAGAEALPRSARNSTAPTPRPARSRAAPLAVTR
jgi:hypothetical protein